VIKTFNKCWKLLAEATKEKGNHLDMGNQCMMLSKAINSANENETLKRHMLRVSEENSKLMSNLGTAKKIIVEVLKESDLKHAQLFCSQFKEEGVKVDGLEITFPDIKDHPEYIKAVT